MICFSFFFLENELVVAGRRGNFNFRYFVFVQCDKKPRQVDEVDGKLWADSHGFHYFETSAATGDGVVEMFNVRNEIHSGREGFFHIEQYYIQRQLSHTKA